MSEPELVVTPGPDWAPLLDRLSGTVMVVGAPNRGKTHLVRYLATGLAVRGRRVALLSADVGQPAVGVPTCLGLSLAPPWQRADAMWFVGTTSPVGHLLQAVAGTARLARRARDEGCDTVLIDTTGLVEGPVARVLKYHKAVAAGVGQVVGLQRDAELEPLLAVLEGPCPLVHRLRPVAEARARDADERRRYREALFRSQFESAAVLELPPERLVGRDWAPAALSGEAFPVAPGTVAGLLDRDGFCLGIGPIEEARPDRLAVFTTWRDAAAVARVQQGRLRLNRQGEEVPRPDAAEQPRPPAGP